VKEASGGKKDCSLCSQLILVSLRHLKHRKEEMGGDERRREEKKRDEKEGEK
jgi:hypothetical protein